MYEKNHRGRGALVFFFFLTGGEIHGKYPSPLEPQFLLLYI